MKQSKTAILVALSLVVIASLMAAGCTGTGETPEETTLTVFTAASLTGAFTDIARAYEAENPGIKVDLVFDGQDAGTQIGRDKRRYLYPQVQSTCKPSRTAGSWIMILFQTSSGTAWP